MYIANCSACSAAVTRSMSPAAYGLLEDQHCVFLSLQHHHPVLTLQDLCAELEVRYAMTLGG